MKGKHHRFNNDNIAHDHNQDHIMRERDNHIATSMSPQPHGGLLMHNHGETERVVDGEVQPQRDDGGGGHGVGGGRQP